MSEVKMISVETIREMIQHAREFPFDSNVEGDWTYTATRVIFALLNEWMELDHELVKVNETERNILIKIIANVLRTNEHFKIASATAISMLSAFSYGCYLRWNQIDPKDQGYIQDTLADAIGMVKTEFQGIEFGPDGIEWAKHLAAEKHLEVMVGLADHFKDGSPLWYGNALRECFISGAVWQENRDTKSTIPSSFPPKPCFTSLKEMASYPHPYTFDVHASDTLDVFPDTKSFMSMAGHDDYWTSRNILTRWDLLENEGSEGYTLRMGFLVQRKGFLWCAVIEKVTEADFPQIYTFIKRHWEMLQKHWAPFAVLATVIPQQSSVVNPSNRKQQFIEHVCRVAEKYMVMPRKDNLTPEEEINYRVLAVVTDILKVLDGSDTTNSNKGYRVIPNDCSLSEDYDISGNLSEMFFDQVNT